MLCIQVLALFYFAVFVGSEGESVNGKAWSKLSSHLNRPDLQYVKHFELVQVEITQNSDFHFKEKKPRNARSKHSTPVLKSSVIFRAFSKNFSLILIPQLNGMFKRVIKTGAKVNVVSEKEKLSFSLEDKLEDLLTGYLFDEKSYAYGTIHNDTFDGVIHGKDDTYHLEPVGRFLGNSSVSRSTVIYRESDVFLSRSHEYTSDEGENERYWSTIRKTNPNTIGQLHREKGSRRNKRSGNITTNCNLHLIADHDFYTNVGLSSIATTTQELVYHITEADIIFRGTDFDGDGDGDNVGFTISTITIYTDMFSPGNKFTSQNIDVYTYLDKLSEYDFDSYCLGVGFTYRDHKGVLGIAWTASSSINGNVGGICQKRVYYPPHDQEYNFNTNMITMQNLGMRLPRRVTILTLTHEFGHNFGSGHDGSGHCSPGGSFGNYLMYPSSSDGDKPNNRAFSQCSKDSVAPVIANKGNCFDEVTGPVCGNGLVEGDEECDCGDAALCSLNDPCCTPPGGEGSDAECHFRRELGKVCSPRVSTCCDDDCQVIPAPQNHVCRPPSDCTESAVCDGNSQCPTVDHKANGTLCYNGARTCMQGECTGSVCERESLQECQCTSPLDKLCHVCCKNTTGSCLPASQFNIFGAESNVLMMYPAQSCNSYHGYCDMEGQCIMVDNESVMRRLRAVFSEDSLNDVVKWFHDYWYFALIGLASLLALTVLFVICMKRKKRDPIATLAYKSGHVAAIWCEARGHLEKITDMIQQVEEKYVETTRKLRNRHKGNVEMVEACARLCFFFPTASTKTVAQVVGRSSSEIYAVKTLLIKGYPMVQLMRRTANRTTCDESKNGQANG